MSQAAPSSIRSYFDNPAFLVLFLVMFSGTAGMGMVSPLLPIFAEDMGASGIWLGLAFSGFAISQTPLMPVFGRLSDRHGRRQFLAAGLAVYVLVAFGMMLAPNFYVLVLMRFISGVGAALLFPIAAAYAGEISPEGEEGAFMGVFNIAFYTGWGIGPLIGGALSDAFGMDAAFGAQAVLATFALAVVLTRLPEPPRRAVGDDEVALTSRQMLGLRPVQALVTFQGIWAFNNGIVLSFLAVYLKDNLGAAAAMVGAILSTRVVMNGLLQAPGGRLADRSSRTVLMAVGMALSGVATFAIPSLGSLALVWALFAFLGIAESLATPAANAIAVETGRSVGMGTLMGVSNTAFSIGMVIGAMAGGVTSDLFGVEEVFRVGGAVALAGAVAVAVVMRRASERPYLAPARIESVILDRVGEA